MPQAQPSICRLCTAHCPILVTVQDGRAVKVEGNPAAPLYQGYTCPKGRALPEQHYGPHRLLHSMVRDADGGHRPVPVEAAMDDIARRVQEIVARDGPRAVAAYFGMGTVPQQPTVYVASAWMKALGSRMHFPAGSIDKPGIIIAMALHGGWMGGQATFEESDTWLVVGANPVISKGPGFSPHNPARQLKDAQGRGAKLIVIDPRETETARRAHVFLQPKPGEDPAILAALAHVIIDERLYDAGFVAENAAGFEELARAVAPFTPQMAAARADVPAEKIIQAARVFAGAKHGGVTCGTGPSFATHGTLTEYLALCLTTLCGRWARAGERVRQPNVLLPAYTAKAQAMPPYQAWGYGEKLRVRGLGSCASGLSAAALADEILLPGPGQVKALICIGGNPMMAFPDQRKTFEALSSLELLVTLDFEMTATARMADYVIAPRLTLETPGTTYPLEAMKYLGTSRGIEHPYAAYTPAITAPPEGSDLIEDWEFFYGLGRRMGFELEPVAGFGMSKHREHGAERAPLDMRAKPTTDELLATMMKSARVPLDEVKRHPHGKVFDIAETVQPRDLGNTDRLDIGNALMLAELAGIAAAPSPAPSPAQAEYPLRLIPRRANNVLNSWGRSMTRLNGAKPYNPAYMHPDDMAAQGIAQGAAVTVTSPHGAIGGFAEADASLRRGVVSMSHAYGDNPDVPEDPKTRGSNVGRLLSVEAEYDPITGIPRMGAVPVAVRPLSAEGPAQ